MDDVFVVILVLLLLAAAFGVLAVVVKTALIIALSIVLAVLLLGAIGYYYAKYRFNQVRRNFEQRSYGPRDLPPSATP
jgi:VIT1/CCC1 family predicted Fe2+/Mn2+ transporter